jgi:hypothetical protein
MLTILLLLSFADGPRQTTSLTANQLVAAERQWIDAYNRRNEQALSAIETDDFLITLGDGRVQNKQDQLTALRKPLPPGAEYRIAVEPGLVRIYGRAAVLTGIVVEQGKFPDQRGAFTQRSRYTDTWILLNGRWRVVASHLSDLK